MNSYGIFLFTIMLGISISIAYFLGRKRQIGFGWSLFFCFFLSPFIGLIITLLSRKYPKNNIEPSKIKKVIGWILIILFAFLGIGQLTIPRPDIGVLSLSIGMIGLGIYLLGMGINKKGNSSIDESWQEYQKEINN